MAADDTAPGDDAVAPADVADIVEMLTADHRRIEGVLAAGDRWAVLHEVSTHLFAETQLLYPELRRSADEDDLVDEALGGDHWIEEALVDIDKERVTDVAQVAELFAAHVERQEAGLFPILRATVDLERRVALADSLGEVVRTAPTHPHPRNPDEGFLEVMADALSAEVDELRDAFHRGKEDRK